MHNCYSTFLVDLPLTACNGRTTERLSHTVRAVLDIICAPHIIDHRKGSPSDLSNEEDFAGAGAVAGLGFDEPSSTMHSTCFRVAASGCCVCFSAEALHLLHVPLSSSRNAYAPRKSMLKGSQLYSLKQVSDCIERLVLDTIQWRVER